MKAFARDPFSSSEMKLKPFDEGSFSKRSNLMEGEMKPRAFECATPRRLLYVEDHEDSREMLVLMLENTGYKMSTASSMAEGLRLIKHERFDLIILDSRLADGSGVDLCRQIRVFDPLTPIVFYSSAVYPSDIAAGLAAGAQQYLTKPMGIYTIVQTIGELLTEAKSAQLEGQYSPNQENEARKFSFLECLA
jgi:DNA-binding response OmpR family regulator